MGGWGGIIAKIITFFLLLRGQILHRSHHLLLLLLLPPGSSVSSFGNVFGFGFLVLVTESAVLVTEPEVDPRGGWVDGGWRKGRFLEEVRLTFEPLTWR